MIHPRSIRRLAMLLIGSVGCKSSPDAPPAKQTQDADSPLDRDAASQPSPEPTSAPADPPAAVPAPEPPLVGTGPSRWRPLPDPASWASKPLSVRSASKRSVPLAANRPRFHRVEYGEMAFFGDELLVRGGRDLADVVYRFSIAGELLATLELDELAAELGNTDCPAYLNSLTPLVVGEDGWWATRVMCESLKHYVSFDGEGRLIGTNQDTQTAAWLLAGRYAVEEIRHVNKFDTLLIGHAVTGASWKREMQDRIFLHAAVGDRLVGTDYDDNLVVLDSRDGTELAARPLPGAPSSFDFAAVGPRELALIEESTITVVDVDSGAQLRSFTHSFDGDDDIIANLWPGPDGGFWLVHDSLRPAATTSLWLIDHEGAQLEKLAQDVHFPTVTEVDGRWLWAVKDGGKLSVPNARKLPAQPDGDLADMLVIGELRPLEPESSSP